MSKSRYQNYKNHQNSYKNSSENAQSVTKNVEDLPLLCEGLQPDVFVVSEQSFTGDTIGHFKINNYELATVYYRTISKGGGMATFVKSNLIFESFEINYSSELDYVVKGVTIYTAKFKRI